MNSNDSQNKHSLHFIVRSGVAGGVAGCVAKTVVAPLDRVKILFQASNPDFQKYAGTWTGAYRVGAQIFNESGIRGLLQGHSATLIRVFPYAAIRFMAYDQIESLLMPTKDKHTPSRRFMAGALSGMTAVFFTYPLELIRVRMAFTTRSSAPNGPSSAPYKPPTFLSAASQIYHEGISGPSQASANPLLNRFPILKFYRGFSVTITGMAFYAGTPFLVWGTLRSRFLPSGGQSKPKVSPIVDLVSGALAGAAGQTVSYPFETVRRRMQVSGLTRPDRWLSWGETVRTIYEAGGWRGFYVGLSIGYLKVVPMTAVSFTVWQWMKRVLDV